MVVGFVVRKLFPYRKEEIDEKVGAAFFASLVHDLDCVTDWIYFFAVINNEQDNVSAVSKISNVSPTGITNILLISCIIGTLTWIIVASDGWLMEWIRKAALIVTIKFFELLNLMIRFPFDILKSILRRFFCGCSGCPCGALKSINSCRHGIDRWFNEKLNKIQYHFYRGYQISFGKVLLLGIVFEDFPQLLITFLIEDGVHDKGRLIEGLSQGALISISMGFLAVVQKLAEAYDLRHQQVQATDGLLETFMDKTLLFKGIKMVDTERFLSLSTENTVKLWNRLTNEIIHTFHATSEDDIDTKIHDVAIIDDNTIATITDFKSITVFDLHTGAIQHNVNHMEGVSKLAVMPGGQHILTDCCQNSSLKLWSKDLDLLGKFSLNNNEFRDCQVEHIVCLSEDDFVAIYAKDVHAKEGHSVSTVFVLWNLMNDHSDPHSCEVHTDTITCATRVDVQSFLTGSLDGTVRRWDAFAGGCLRAFAHAQGVTDVAVCTVSDGQCFVSGSYDGSARIWNIVDGSCLHTFRSIRGRVRSVKFVANGDDEKILISDDWCISCWSLEESRSASSIRSSTMGQVGGVHAYLGIPGEELDFAGNRFSMS